MTYNLLFVVLDAARVDHLSAYGYDRPTTPNLESLAEDAVRFENAFAAAPWTPPSHASMFTGTYPSTHGYFDAGMGIDVEQTLAEHLSAQGYRTFGVVQNAKIGDETDVARGFDDYVPLYRLPFVPSNWAEFRRFYLDLLPGFVSFALSYPLMDRKPAEYLSTTAVRRRVTRHDDERPFFGFVNLSAAHSPYSPPRRFRKQFERFDSSDVDLEQVRALADKGGYRYVAGELNPTESEWQAVKDWYDGELAFVDALLGRLLETLCQAGIYDETMIVVTADHGEHFGEHGRAYHQFSLFDELIHIPLIIKRPGGSGRGRRTDLVSHVDLFPSVCDELDVDRPANAAGDGISVFEEQRRETVFAEYGEPVTALTSLGNHTETAVPESVRAKLDHGLQCARTADYKYIRRLGGEDFLTRVGDGTEVVVEHPTPAEQSVGHDLADRIDMTLSEHPRDLSPAEPSDERVRQNLEDLGYL